MAYRYGSIRYPVAISRVATNWVLRDVFITSLLHNGSGGGGICERMICLSTDGQ